MAGTGSNMARQAVGLLTLGISALTVIYVLSPFFTRLSGGMLALLGVVSLAAIPLVFRPLALLWFVTIFTLVISGTVKYFFPGLGLISWAVYGSATMLYMTAGVQLFRRGGVATPRGIPWTLVFLSLFFLVILSGLAVNAPPKEQVTAAVKSLLFMGGVWAVFATGAFSRRQVDVWLKGLLIIAAIQILFVLYQYFFVRSFRMHAGLGTVEASDSVVGTFGGSMVSGGLTAVLAFFLVSAALFLISFRLSRRIAGRRFILLLGVVLLPLLFMEVKVIFFYIPVGIAALLGGRLFRRPLLLLAYAIGSVALIAGFLAAYQAFHWSAQGEDWRENVERAFSYSFSSEAGYESARYGLLTRRGVLEYWFEQHGSGNWLETFVGHGLGAARTSGQVLGEQARAHYPKNIDRTGIAMMLWEVGLLGVLAMLGIWFAAFAKANRVVRVTGTSEWAHAVARGLRGALILVPMSFLYRNDIPYAAPMMFLVMAMFGLAGWLEHQRRAAS